jgi:hypothetical protein
MSHVVKGWLTRASATLGTLTAAGFLALAPAAAEEPSLSPGYAADTLTFEVWCSEIKRYESERCARKDESDLAAYRHSLSRLESIEVEHDIKARKEREFRKTFDAHTTVDRNRRFDF